MTGTISTQMDHTFYNKKLRSFKEIVEKILELKIDNKTRKFEYVLLLLSLPKIYNFKLSKNQQNIKQKSCNCNAWIKRIALYN